MRLKLIEADDNSTEETPVETTNNPPQGDTENKESGSKPSWDSLPIETKVNEFEKYYNSGLPPFNDVPKINGVPKPFDRNNKQNVNAYINNVFGDVKFKTALTLSIQEYGVNPKDNKFIPFALFAITDNNIDNEKADLIRQYLQKGTIDINETNWVKNKQAYKDGKYKVQALILLSDENEVKKYMDPELVKDKDGKEGLISKVLKLEKDEDIRAALNNAQTRHGEDKYVYGSGSGSSGAEITSKEKLIKLATSLGLPQESATKKVNDIFDPKESEASLLHKIALMTAKEKGIDLTATETDSSGATKDTNKGT